MALQASSKFLKILRNFRGDNGILKSAQKYLGDKAYSNETIVRKRLFESMFLAFYPQVKKSKNYLKEIPVFNPSNFIIIFK